MPRLHGFYSYQFVAPGFVHPKGWRFDIITLQNEWGPTIRSPASPEDAAEYADRIAKRQEQWAHLLELDTVECAKYGHEFAARPVKAIGDEHDLATACGIGLHADARPGEWFCQTRARLARECTRTAERTMLIRVHIDVDEVRRHDEST